MGLDRLTRLIKSITYKFTYKLSLGCYSLVISNIIKEVHKVKDVQKLYFGEPPRFVKKRIMNNTNTNSQVSRMNQEARETEPQRLQREADNFTKKFEHEKK